MNKFFKVLSVILTTGLIVSNTCMVYATEADALAAWALQQAALNQTMGGTGSSGGMTIAEQLQKQQQEAASAILKQQQEALKAAQQAALNSQLATAQSQAQQAAVQDQIQKQRSAAQSAQSDPAKQAAIASGSYIDVNKTTQTLSLYSGGQIIYVTPVVTGNVRAGHNTPNGVYSIYAKQTNRTLKGPNYESFVKYWLPFYKGYGIHDANWRSEGEFGGSTYQTSGSHGCVNIPPANMPALFAAVGVGTPVVVHD